MLSHTDSPRTYPTEDPRITTEGHHTAVSGTTSFIAEQNTKAKHAIMITALLSTAKAVTSVLV